MLVMGRSLHLSRGDGLGVLKTKARELGESYAKKTCEEKSNEDEVFHPEIIRKTSWNDNLRLQYPIFQELIMTRIFFALILTTSFAFACELLSPTQFSGEVESKALYSVYGGVDNKEENYYEVKVFEAKELKGAAFRKRLAEHLKMISQTMKPLGQIGYLTYANDHQEFALIQWKSKAAMEKARKEKGALIQKDANSFMKEVVSEKVNRDYYPLSIEYINYQLGRTTNSGLKPPHSH